MDTVHCDANTPQFQSPKGGTAFLGRPAFHFFVTSFFARSRIGQKIEGQKIIAFG